MHTRSKYRLLVVRLGAMGDILHALPAVTALRRAHAEWEIGWVVEPRWHALLTAGNGEGERGARQPVVDRVHLAPTREWRRAPLSMETIRGILGLREELRGCGYEAVLDLQGAIRSSAIGRLTGCARRIGEDAPRERAARWLFSERIGTRGKHVIEQDVELASAVAGDELAAVAPELPVGQEADAWCDGLLEAGGVSQVALVNPGAGWGAKRWPAERYGAVARGLAKRGFRVLVNAGPGERALAETVVQSAGPGAGSAGGAAVVEASLVQLIALTRRIGLCIAGDTGPLHLACALKRPVVGIYGPTDPGRNGPFDTRFRVLRSPESRTDHTRHSVAEAGLLRIQPEDVLKAADELLAEGLGQ